MKKIIIIGAGFGGLSAAAFLSKAGFDVEVFEKNDQPGGKAMYFEAEGFKFDMGPSWYMMPEVFEDFFKKLGKNREDYYSLSKLNPNYRVFWDDGDQADISNKFEEIKKFFEKYEKGSSGKLDKFINLAQEKYDKAINNYIYRNFKNIFELLSFDLIKNIFRLGFLNNWQSHVDKYFKTQKLKQLLLWHASFVGGVPKNIPALYSLMAYVDMKLNIWYPEKGFQSVVEAMEKVGREFGAKFLYNTAVEQIIIDKGKAIGVSVDGIIHPADIVISNADYRYTDQILLPEEFRSYSKKYWENRKLGPATYCVYLGINKKLNGLAHHNYYFTKDWDDYFKTIFEKPAWPENPSFYISAPSKTDPNIASKNCENLFLLVPLAPGLEDTDEKREELFKKIVTELEKITKEGIMDNIVYKRIISHRDHIQLYNSYKGNALGLAHTLFQTGPLRPSMKSKKVKNLFFTGSYTQPGTSVAICTISGELVAKEVEKYTQTN